MFLCGLLQWIPRPRERVDRVFRALSSFWLPFLPSALQNIAERLGSSIDKAVDLWPLIPALPVLFMAGIGFRFELGFFNQISSLLCGFFFPLYSYIVYSQETLHPSKATTEMYWLSYWTVYFPFWMVCQLLSPLLSSLPLWYNMISLVTLGLLWNWAEVIIRELDLLFYPLPKPAMFGVSPAPCPVVPTARSRLRKEAVTPTRELRERRSLLK